MGKERKYGGPSDYHIKYSAVIDVARQDCGRLNYGEVAKILCKRRTDAAQARKCGASRKERSHNSVVIGLAIQAFGGLNYGEEPN